MESSHLFIAKIANIWQLLYSTSFKKEESFLQLEPVPVFNQGSYASPKEQQVLIQGGHCLTQLASLFGKYI